MKKKILVVGMSGNIGGIETYYKRYYDLFDSNKMQVDFLSEYKNIAFQEEYEKNGSKIKQISHSKKKPFAYMKELKKILQEENYDIVHINMLSAANILPILVSKRHGVKRIIVHSHNAGIPSGYLRKVLHSVNVNYIKRNATEFWGCSQLAIEWLFPNVKSKAILVPNALKNEEVLYDKVTRLEIRKQLESENFFLVGHVGAFREQKNHEFIAEIIQDTVRDNSDIVFVLMGEGETKEEFKKKIKEMGVEKSVKVVNNQNFRASELYQAMDLFILPSKFEGLPVVGVEAQGTGVDCLFSEKISKEVDLLQTSAFLPISSTKPWVESIEKIQGHQKDFEAHRLENIQKFSRTAYVINKDSNLVQNLYLQT